MHSLLTDILLCGITATPPHKDIHKTALGATESVEWKYYHETATAIKELRQENYHIVAVEQTEKSISLDRFRVKRNMKYALIFGHEIRGVSQDIVDMSHTSLDIPQFGTKHSLNISVCAGMVIWEVFRQIRL